MNIVSDPSSLLTPLQPVQNRFMPKHQVKPKAREKDLPLNLGKVKKFDQLALKLGLMDDVTSDDTSAPVEPKKKATQHQFSLTDTSQISKNKTES